MVEVMQTLARRQMCVHYARHCGVQLFIAFSTRRSAFNMGKLEWTEGPRVCSRDVSLSSHRSQRWLPLECHETTSAQPPPSRLWTPSYLGTKRSARAPQSGARTPRSRRPRARSCAGARPASPASRGSLSGPGQEAGPALRHERRDLQRVPSLEVFGLIV